MKIPTAVVLSAALLTACAPAPASDQTRPSLSESMTNVAAEPAATSLNDDARASATAILALLRLEAEDPSFAALAELGHLRGVALDPGTGGGGTLYLEGVDLLVPGHPEQQLVVREARGPASSVFAASLTTGASAVVPGEARELDVDGAWLTRLLIERADEIALDPTAPNALALRSFFANGSLSVEQATVQRLDPYTTRFALAAHGRTLAILEQVVTDDAGTRNVVTVTSATPR